MNKFIDETGKRHGRLTVLERAGKQYRSTMWKCVCDCGEIVVTRAEALRNGRARQCIHCGTATHGHARKGKVSREFHCWCGMRHRCGHGNGPPHPDYGGRGISVCERWRESFEAFLEDMGPSPSPKHSVDRKDVNGDYCPENCRWATHHQQARNTRSNRLIEYRGETKCLAEWCDELGLSYSIAIQRLRRGYTVADAFDPTPRKPGVRNQARLA